MMMMMDECRRQHYHGLVGPWADGNVVETSMAAARAFRPRRSRTASTARVVDVVHGGAQFDQLDVR